MVRHLFLLLLVSASGCFSGFAEEKAIEVWKVDAKKRIKLLGSEKYQAREKASEALLDFGWKVMPLLKAELETSKDIEVNVRLKKLILKIPLIHPIKNADATVRGLITFEGKRPIREIIPTAPDPKCAAQHKHAPLKSETIIVGAKGELQNVLIYVSKGLEKFKFPVPKVSFLLDQKGCRYQPHIFGIRAGQTLRIRNEDNTLHNVHAIPEINEEFNISMSGPGKHNDKVFHSAEIFPLKCDVHPWMIAWCGVFENPYFTTSKSDGTFKLPTLPKGKFTLSFWHEKLGRQEIEVDLSTKKLTELKIVFKKKVKQK